MTEDKNETRRWFTYIVRCSDGTLYTGYTVGDLDHRLAAHNAGRGAKYTKTRRPVVLVWHREWDNAHDARSMEARIKHFPKEKKEALVRGDGL